MNSTEQKSAVLSADEKYRFKLSRRWDVGIGTVAWIMLNPSTADATNDDPTIKKCIKFAKRWGFGSIDVVNLFAYRATNPKALKSLTRAEAVGPDNDDAIWSVTSEAELCIAAWGQGGLIHGRAQEVLSGPLRDLDLHALKRATNGMPYHPLYVKDNAELFML